jgi:hypothetical protein
MKVALLGMGPSADGYPRYCAVRGGRNVAFDETWTVNAFGDIYKADLIFHMDDVRIQQIRADAGNDQIARMLEWMRKHPGPIFTSRAHPDYPGLVDFPLEEVLTSTGGPIYFNSTPAYAVAYAIHKGVKEFAPFGLDYAYHPKFNGEQGRACVEYWLGRAVGGQSQDGMHLYLPRDTFLLDTRCNKLYGYDTVDVKIETREDGTPQVTFTEKEKLPTAEEIEQAYFHLVRKEDG